MSGMFSWGIVTMSLKKWAPYMLSKLLKLSSHHALHAYSLRFEIKDNLY